MLPSWACTVELCTGITAVRGISGIEGIDPKMRAIITVIGSDKVGIIARVSTLLAEHQVNILDISQTTMQEYFTMIMLVDLTAMTASFSDLEGRLEETGKAMDLSIQMQREDIFQSMHQI